MSFESEVEFFSYDHVPVGRDLHLIKSSDRDFLVRTWTYYVSDEEEKEHPNNHLIYRIAAIENISTNFMVVNVCVDQTKRYHSVLVILPKEDFIDCMKCWNYEERAYLIVSDEWFESLSVGRYSTFALIDADGVKKELAEKGTLDKKKIKIFRKRLNKLSRRYRRYLFLSFADSVFIKTSWTGSIKYFYEYNPEEMIQLVQKIRQLFQEVLGLNSYAILSQGTTVDYGSDLYEKAFLGKHFSIGSLGSPVAHLFEIDMAARANSKNVVHPACSAYLSTKFFDTLLLNSESKNEFREREVIFDSKVSEYEDNGYIPVDIQILIENFRLETLKDAFWRIRFNYFWSTRTFIRRKLRSIKLWWQ